MTKRKQKNDSSIGYHKGRIDSILKKKRAFLKWAGGKYHFIEDIRRYLPVADCLIEPFVGAGSVFLNTHYRSYILADVNRDLTSLYNIIKSRVDDFVRDSRLLFHHQFNNAKQFYRLRQEFNTCRNEYRRALLFLYLNRHGYNGLCRYNLKGEFNVPFGSYKKPYFPEAELYFFSEKAQHATFICEDYQKTLMKASEGAVVYCDPPYVPLSMTANFTSYYRNGFNVLDQQNLAKLAYQVSSESRVSVLISNHDTALTREWYHQASLHVVKARRNISCHGFGRRKVNELLALYR